MVEVCGKYLCGVLVEVRGAYLCVDVWKFDPARSIGVDG
jgi:hypothetical protein